MLPHSMWPATLRDFERKWTEYKLANGLLDFTDLIEVAMRDVAIAPKNPSVIFIDEAQDLNRMQLSLVRKWGERANYFIVAGDDDQTLYSFSGASPDAFLDPDVPDDHKIILKQSYRVPRAVHRFANDLIHRVTRRQEKEYLPRPEDGEFRRLSGGTYKRPECGTLTAAMKHIENGKTVMFLVACSYMLRPLIQVLRKGGIPFHNPYRKSNGFWNPLRTGARVSTAGRILSLLAGHPDFGEGHRPWTHGDLAQWAELLRGKGVLRHGAKKRLASYDLAKPVEYEALAELFEQEAIESLQVAYDGSCRDLLEWWRARVTADVVDRVRFPSEVAAKRGPRALAETPQVVVGTIHSVKGGQSDGVCLFPDLSQAGAAQYNRGGASRDSVIRQFYVGVTRAREALYVCSQDSPLAIQM